MRGAPVAWDIVSGNDPQSAEAGSAQDHYQPCGMRVTVTLEGNGVGKGGSLSTRSSGQNRVPSCVRKAYVW